MQRELENRASNTDNAAALTSRRRVFGSYALVGTQRAEYVQFKQIRKINFPETTLDYLYSLKQLQHDNLAKFYGIQVNDDIMTMTILHTLVERGTLEVINGHPGNPKNIKNMFSGILSRPRFRNG